jgi:hypothetical protein
MVGAMRAALASLLVLPALAAACGGGSDNPADASAVDASPADAALPLVDADPATLASTGLCGDGACTTIAADVRAYTPRWPLWSDGAEKKRWIWLPPGTQIDTTDMNAWKFPDGTKLWKEFSKDGVRLETRLFTKVAEGDWFRVAYAWNEAQTEARELPGGADNVLGTGHDIPSRRDCGQCHDRVSDDDRVLGFAAMQLDHDGAEGELDLADLVRLELLTAPPAAPAAGQPFFPLPTTVGAGEDVATVHAALGYMHANCGPCHSVKSELFSSGKARFDTRLEIGQLASAAATPAYTTLVGQRAVMSIPYNPPDQPARAVLVEPRSVDRSVLMARFTRYTDTIRMPPLATEQTDPAALTLLTAWVEALPVP